MAPLYALSVELGAWAAPHWCVDSVKGAWVGPAEKFRVLYLDYGAFNAVSDPCSRRCVVMGAHRRSMN